MLCSSQIATDLGDTLSVFRDLQLRQSFKSLIRENIILNYNWVSTTNEGLIQTSTICSFIISVLAVYLTLSHSCSKEALY